MNVNIIENEKVWLYKVGAIGFESLAKKLKQGDKTIRKIDERVSSNLKLHQVAKSFALMSCGDYVSCYSINALEDDIRRNRNLIVDHIIPLPPCVIDNRLSYNIWIVPYLSYVNLPYLTIRLKVEYLRCKRRAIRD